MLMEYKINLMFYHRADIPAYTWDIDFGFITYMSPDCYGRKCYSLRTSFPISIDLKQAMVENQLVFLEPIPMNTISDVTELDKETDVVHANTENRMDTSDLAQSESESHAKASEVANVDTNKTDMQNIPETDKEIDITNYSGAVNDNLQRDINDQTTKENVANETLEELKNNPNVNIVATIDEFDETVEYPSPNGSQSTSSGSSPHSDDDGNEAQSPENVPSDLLRKPHKRTHRKAQHTYAKPSRTQPSRAKKHAPTFLPDTDDSSIESENDGKDNDFIPEGIKGKCS